MEPSTKISAASIGGALTAIVLWGVNHFTGVDVPPEVAAAITTVVAFLLGYFIPETNPAPSAVEAIEVRTEVPPSL